MAASRLGTKLLALSASGISGWALLLAVPSFAQITVDNTLGPGGPVAPVGNEYSITENLGKTVGSNLFHSFSTFNLGTNEVAAFSAVTPGLERVISRVTGASSSSIDGVLRSTIAGADFYFINPRGIVFGPNAQVDVGGAFYASTAGYVKLADGGRFDAVNPGASVLTTAPPSAFGFLGPPQPILTQGAQLLNVPFLDFVGARTFIQPPGQSFNLVGGDITLDAAPPGQPTWFGTPNSSGTFLANPGGSVRLVSVASAGEATRTESGGFDLSSFGRLGTVRIANGSVVDATEVYIRSGQLTVENALIAPGFFEQGFFSLFVPPGVALPPGGGGVDIEALDAAAVTATMPLAVEIFNPFIGEVVTPSRPSFAPMPSGIYTFAGNALTGAPPADVPGIRLVGGSVSVSGGASVVSERYGPGQGADILVQGGTIEVSDGGAIANINYFDGPGGSVTLDAQRVTLSGSPNFIFTGVNAISDFNPLFGLPPPDPAPYNPFDPSFTTGAGASIAVRASGDGGLQIRNGAIITTESRAFGRAGDVTITASDVLLSRDGAPLGSIASQSAFAGDSGDIVIDASGTVQIRDGFEVSATSAGTGAGGRVTVSAAESITIEGEGSGIYGATVYPPPPVRDDLARRFGVGSYDELVAVLASFGLLPPGEDDFFEVLGALQALGLIDLGDPDPAPGDGGALSITTPLLVMEGASRIDSSTTSDGHGGTVTGRVGTLRMSGGSEIRSRSGGREAGTGALVVGTGNAGVLDFVASGTITATGVDTGFFATTLGEGNSGRIAIAADKLSLADGAAISASSFGTGLAGDIAITLGDSLEMRGASIGTQAVVSDGGNITITAPRLIHLVDSQITTSVESGTGGGGNISIDPRFVILQNSQIIANAFGGPGGNINIVAGQLIIDPFSVISASSALGIDGTVNIDAPDTNVSSALVALPESYLDASSLLQPSCGAARAGLSSLVEVGRGGLPPDPDGYLWSVDVDTKTVAPASRRTAARAAANPFEGALAFAGQGCRR